MTTASRSVRYEVFEEIASGGMASVHLARAVGDAGFARVVALKRPHAHVAKDPAVLAALVDEAKIAARIRHRNVVSVIDVVEDEPLSIVMEYVHGPSLASLLDTAAERGLPPEPRVAAAIIAGVLQGLHAAHEATNEQGQPLEVVHRDVSPQNVLVDVHGVARVVDFGIAKALGRLETTRDGALKGKLAYLAPEQLRRRPATRRTDVYATAVVLWETLTAKRLFDGATEAETVAEVLRGRAPAPSSIVGAAPRALDEVVARGLARDPGRRFATARDMLSALEQATPIASEPEVAKWIEQIAGDALRKREKILRRVEPAIARAAPMIDAPPERPRRRRTVVRTFAIAALVATMVVAVSYATRDAPDVSNAPAPTPPASVASAEPSSAPPSEEEPTTTRPHDPSEAPTTRARTHRPPPRRAPPAAPAPKAPASCDPPTYVDENGHTRYKRWCPL